MKGEKMYCSKCGAEMSNDSAFCPKCGNDMSQDKETAELNNQLLSSQPAQQDLHNEQAVSPMQNETQNSKKKGLLFSILLGIIGVVAVISIVFIVKQGNAREDMQTAERINYVREGNPILIPDITYDEAYSYFFADPKWDYFISDKGEEVVEFKGECTYYEQPAKVCVQFVLDNDFNFSLYYVGIDVDGKEQQASDDEFLAMCYRPFEVYSQDVLGKELDDDAMESFEAAFLMLHASEVDDFSFDDQDEETNSPSTPSNSTQNEHTEYENVDMSVPDYVFLYSDILDDEAVNAEFPGNTTYTMYDINDDGIYEMIVRPGSSGGFIDSIYTCDKNGAVSGIGFIGGSSGVYYAAEIGNGLYLCDGIQGYQTISQITISGNSLEQAILEERQLNPGEDYYSNPYELIMCYASDKSLLQHPENSVQQGGTSGSVMAESAYILPDAQTSYYTEADLYLLTKEDLRIARNEILARHGRRFNDENLQRYFDAQSWYNGSIPPEQFDSTMDSVLNQYEKANIELIKKLEAQ